MERKSGGGPGGGGRGVHPPPPPQDDLRFSDTTGILQKKTMWFLVLKQSKRQVHPLLKEILDPPLRSVMSVYHGGKISGPKQSFLTEMAICVVK